MLFLKSGGFKICNIRELFNLKNVTPLPYLAVSSPSSPFPLPSLSLRSRPLKSSYEIRGSTVSSLSGVVWGKAEIGFGAFFALKCDI